jgi:hypothetical protein
MRSVSLVTVVWSVSASTHEFSPRAVDPSLPSTTPNADHIAEAPASSPAPLGLLNVFLPGTGAAPSCCTDVLASSAASGFHVLGLSYEWCSKSVAATAAWCEENAPGDCGCQGRVHASVCEGGDFSPLLNVSAASSIVGRLGSALAYLSKTWPEEGWGAFLQPSCAGSSGGSAPCVAAVAWEKIVLSGHSQGAGHAAWLGKLRYSVAGVAPLSGPEDTNASCSWASGPEQATPAHRFVPLAHAEEGSIAEIRANWQAMGLGGGAGGGRGWPGCEVEVGAANATAGGWEGCALLTSVRPAIDFEKLRPEHCSTAVDVFTPKAAAGKKSGALYSLGVWPWLLRTATKALPVVTGPSCNFFVSFASGSDGAAGTLSAPFKTLAHAAYLPTAGGRTICLRSDGLHRLSGPLYVNSAMSSAARPLAISGYGPDIAAGLGRPILSTGVMVGPFAPDPVASERLRKSVPLPGSRGGGSANTGQAVWSAPVPSGVPRPSVMWSETGAWLQRARHPNKAPADGYSRYMGAASTLRYSAPLVPVNADGTWPAVDATGFRINASDFGWVPPGGLHRLEEVQLLHFHSWTAFWSNVSKLDLAAQELKFTQPTRTSVGQWAAQGGRRFLLENVREALDEDGEWYWDEGEGKVFLVVNKDEVTGQQSASPLYAVAENPGSTSLIQLLSNAAFTTLVDLELRHAAVGERVDQYYTQSAAIRITQSSNVSISRVRVSACGGCGILGVSAVSGLSVLDSAVESVGADGIAFSNSGNVTDVIVNNSFVNDTARVILGQPGGIRLKGEARISATFNTVSHTPYAGIMVGWQTGMTRAASAARSAAGDPIFTVEHNLVTDYGLGVLSDFGGIYLSAGSTCIDSKPAPTCWLPTRVRFNEVRNGTRFDYGAMGIYMDEQVSGVEMDSNVLWGAQDQAVYFHCGADNRFANNIAVADCWGKPYLNDKVLPAMCNAGGNPTWPDMRGVIGFAFERNVVLVDASEGVKTGVDYGHSDTRNASFSGNVYWSVSPPTAAMLKAAPMWPNASQAVQKRGVTGVDWATWQRSGNDVNSTIANPLFRNWAARDFTLAPRSPALARGFVPFDTAAAGCSNNPFEPAAGTVVGPEKVPLQV